MNRIFLMLLGLGIVLLGCKGSPEGSSEPTQPVATASAACAEELPINAYQRITWQDLKDVSFEEKYFEEIQEWLLFPQFGDSVQTLDDQPVMLQGYVIPLEAGRYFLSENPNASCFFCGAAGPESVVALELTDPAALYATDEFLSFKGTFHLNDTDYDQLNYVLQCAEPLNPR
jgi:hypothetical protein